MKWVYAFNEGNGKMKSLLGGKGANLAEMTNLGIPVPYGFVVSTDACHTYFDAGKMLPEELKEQIKEGVRNLEKQSGKNFSSSDHPLLVSVRSGSPVSMPGMMDTILNLGLNFDITRALGKLMNNMPFAYDSFRRFIQMYSDVVLGVEKYKFDDIIEKYEYKYDIDNLKELSDDAFESLIEDYLKLVKQELGREFPQDPWEQLYGAVSAVFESWNTPRAIHYRKINDIPSNLGTAVNIQMMVFGNFDNNSGTGVVFTRNPVNGNDELYGEYLINAQGEDVVAGIKTPEQISKLHEEMPEIYNELYRICKKLENHDKDVQDIEFTVECGKLYFLQTRRGKRNAEAALKIAIDLVKEGLIDKNEAIMRIEPKSLDSLLHARFDDSKLHEYTPVAQGLPASLGAAVGRVYFHAKDVVQAKDLAVKTVLVRKETSPEDIEGMTYAEGIVTSRGGMTSHAAVVARSMGKCCVVGCHDMVVDEENRIIKIGDLIIKEGDTISVDGTTGKIYNVELPMQDAAHSDDLITMIDWAKEVSKISVRANGDTPTDAKVALGFGATGIGLCRTEHMFFEPSRILAVREMILAENVAQRQIALNKILPYQKKDFIEILSEMDGKGVTVRYLDPPLHEFLPKTSAEIKELADYTEKYEKDIEFMIDELKEVNPMLGHRGCRLAITYPEIYDMQTRALMEAACEVKASGLNPIVEIMIPLVAFENEVVILTKRVVEVAETVMQEKGIRVDYKVGTMIEVPRAALIAEKIAKHVEFFSFGTNDLTQMTLGFSRDDASKFIGDYVNNKIFEYDPFTTIDFEGVGQLLSLACQKGRSVKGDLKLGICGEHGGDPKSIAFAYKNGLDYVSCSPYRIPIAWVACAQASLSE